MISNQGKKNAMSAIDQKIKSFQSVLLSLESGLIALSGGVDSSVLLALAAETEGFSAQAATVHSAAHPMSELNAAAYLAERYDIPHHIIEINELDDPLIRKNDALRCYHCKFLRYSKLLDLARSLGLKTVLDGSHADDMASDRPGINAIRELSIQTPLQDAGFTKDEIRKIALAKAIPVWNNPATACFYTRIPQNEPLELDRIRRVSLGEKILIDSGFKNVRLRDHGSIARIELPPEMIEKFITHPTQHKLLKELKNLGYRHICVDLDGYRSK